MRRLAKFRKFVMALFFPKPLIKKGVALQHPTSTFATIMTRHRLLSPRQIESRIADGQIIVIYNQHALRLDSWLMQHPGGQLAILHMVGRDATDEINV